MELLAIEPTNITPKIVCDADKGLVFMEGDSYPENSFEFFKDLLAWIEGYLATKKMLNVELRLVYLNTSSVKVMMDIFELLENAHTKGEEVSVTWFYDSRNERVIDLAEEFKEDCTFPFSITTL